MEPQEKSDMATPHIPKFVVVCFTSDGLYSTILNTASEIKAGRLELKKESEVICKIGKTLYEAKIVASGGKKI